MKTLPILARFRWRNPAGRRASAARPDPERLDDHLLADIGLERRAPPRNQIGLAPR